MEAIIDAQMWGLMTDREENRANERTKLYFYGLHSGCQIRVKRLIVLQPLTSMLSVDKDTDNIVYMLCG